MHALASRSHSTHLRCSVHATDWSPCCDSAHAYPRCCLSANQITCSQFLDVLLHMLKLAIRMLPKKNPTYHFQILVNCCNKYMESSWEGRSKRRGRSLTAHWAFSGFVVKRNVRGLLQVLAFSRHLGLHLCHSELVSAHLLLYFFNCLLYTSDAADE